MKAVLAAALLALAASPAPQSRSVSSDGAFAAAVAELARTGGTIRLRAHAYGDLYVPPRSGPTLRLVGERGTTVRGLLLDGASDVLVSDVTVAPVGGNARLELRSAARVELDHVLVTAVGTPFTATLALPGSRDVTVRDSEFSHCGDRSAEFADCVLLLRASHVRIENSWFHDCRGCDFIHGRYGTGLTLIGNRFERALPCRMGGRRCGHQDLVELFSGKRLVVERNLFGVYRRGGAQLYVTNDIDHVRIVNNVFLGTDARVPGYRPRVAIVIGSRGYVRVPHDVLIANNTILSGATRIDRYRGSIRMSTMYGIVPRGERPVVANNVIALLGDPHHVCDEVQRSVRNVVLSGSGCSTSDAIGNADLDALGMPTASSTLLIDRANGRYAPRVDFTGRPRDGRPDVGAFEYRP